jgi:hypothetical protein
MQEASDCRCHLVHGTVIAPWCAYATTRRVGATRRASDRAVYKHGVPMSRAQKEAMSTGKGQPAHLRYQGLFSDNAITNGGILCLIGRKDPTTERQMLLQIVPNKSVKAPGALHHNAGRYPRTLVYTFTYKSFDRQQLLY